MNEDLTSNQNLGNNPEERFEHLKLVVDQGQAPMRIDKYIISFTENISRNKIQNAAKENGLQVNQQPVKTNYKVRPNDVITIMLPQPMKTFTMIPEKMDLNIVYEDEHVMVINKDAGMVVHPGSGNWSGTLSHGIAYHLGEKRNGLNPERPGIVHRIDKWTSGLLVVAKNEFAVTHLSKQFFDKTVDRIYEAIAWGMFEEPEGTITGNIARSQKDRKIFQVYEDETIGKHAVTHYKTIEDLGYVSHIQCKLETGRTHQIRVHMRYLGHPLFADQEYGGNTIVKGTVFTKYRQFVDNCFKLCNRQALHAKTLAFTHPVTGERLSFDSELAEDMQAVLTKWQGYAKQLKR